MKSLAGTLAAPPVGAQPLTWQGKVFPGYVVSSSGEIWSLRSQRLLKPYPTRDGYLAVALRQDGCTYRASVHGIVAATFIGPRPPGADVCHFDGDKTHNGAANLRYATRSENIADKRRHGTDQRGERNPSAKLTDEQAAAIRARRRSGEQLASLAAEFGVAQSCISRIATGARRAA